jgi:tetraacyldisaccharide 4'-kinase
MKTPGFWQNGNGISTLLTPLSWLYAIGVWLDRRFTRPQKAPLTVILIGNVTAGGAGKTPTALALAPMLQAMGFVPHFATRGYGAAQIPTAHRVTDQDDYKEVGDEALLLARVAPTWVGRDRLASANAAASAGAAVLICDDGLQHHRLHKDLSLLVIDGPYGMGNGRLLPAGPLREPFTAALARCDAVVMIGADAQQLFSRMDKPIFRAEFVPLVDVTALQQSRWLAFAGTGRPEKFFTSLRDLGITLVGSKAFADHHPYSEADMAALFEEAQRLSAQLITTEKDMVRIPSHLRDQITVLPVTLRFENSEGFKQFVQQSLKRSRA